MNRQTEKKDNRKGLWQGQLVNRACVLLAVAASTALWSGCNESDEIHAMAARLVPGIEIVPIGISGASFSDRDRSGRIAEYPKITDLGENDRHAVADEFARFNGLTSDCGRSRSTTAKIVD